MLLHGKTISQILEQSYIKQIILETRYSENSLKQYHTYAAVEVIDNNTEQ